MEIAEFDAKLKEKSWCNFICFNGDISNDNPLINIRYDGEEKKPYEITGDTVDDDGLQLNMFSARFATVDELLNAYPDCKKFIEQSDGRFFDFAILI